MSLEKICKNQTSVTFFRLTVLIAFSLFAFSELFREYREILLIIEIVLAIWIRLNLRYYKMFLKFLMISFLGLFLIFFVAYGSFWEAIHLFLDYMFTILIVSLATFIFYDLTPPIDLIQALHKLHIPKEFVFAISIALQFLPLITQQVYQILIHQQARGYRLHIWKLTPLIFPAILQLLDFSLNLAISMESRGFSLEVSAHTQN